MLEFVRCPRCKGSLTVLTPDRVACTNCLEVYPQVAEIPDLRWRDGEKDIGPDPLVDQLLASYAHSNFVEMIALLVRRTTNSDRLISHYLDYALDQKRGIRMYRMFASAWQTRYGPLSGKNSLALDLGCGAGIGTCSLAANYDHVVGVDPDLASLIVAKKLFEENGVKNVSLVQGHAQRLPLKTNIFSWCQAQNSLEHLFDVPSALQEVRRILQFGGAFCADSRNRYDLFLKEPHAKIRWVGWWPRSLMEWYVRVRTGGPYRGVHLLSLWDLRRALSETFGSSNYEIRLPDVVAYGYPSTWNDLVELINRIPLVRLGLLAVFPSHLVLAQKG